MQIQYDNWHSITSTDVAQKYIFNAVLLLQVIRLSVRPWRWGTVVVGLLLK